MLFLIFFGYNTYNCIFIGKEGHRMQTIIDYKAMGNRIRLARKSKKISQERLAEICSLSAAHIGHIERGTRIPSLDTLFKISQSLDISLDYLMLDSLENSSVALTNLQSIIQKMPPQKQAHIISAIKALCSYDTNNH